MIARGLASTRHPLLAHIIPMRRCNLACAYCNEYDDHSPPVPTEEMYRRLDKLAELGTSIITISGGEPLMHPEIEKIIARIRGRDMIAGLITNGYLLVPDKIKALNDAGLEYLQISIDNIEPDEVSMKSLKVLELKLQYLRRVLRFRCEHQLRDRRRYQDAGRRSSHYGVGAASGILDVVRNYS